MEGFEREMTRQKERARAASQFGAERAALDAGGRDRLHRLRAPADQATVVALYQDGASVDSWARARRGWWCWTSPPSTPSPAARWGTGALTAETARFEVTDTRKQGARRRPPGAGRGGELHVGDRSRPGSTAERRRATALNHSATHLLHAALRQVLGEHVQQKGSLVDPDRLRFDFSHFEPVTREQLLEIERLVNREIRENHMVETRIMSLDDARASGAVALFGEKYADQVRVLRMGDFSTELCGGTHVRAVGDIGLFKIVAEGGIAAGVRRIEAVTGERAPWSGWRRTRSACCASPPGQGGSREDVDDKVVQLIDRTRGLEKELERAQGQARQRAGSGPRLPGGGDGRVKVLAVRLDGVDPKSLREALDQLKGKLGSAVVVLAAECRRQGQPGRRRHPDLTDRVKAGDLIREVAAKVGGKGGGRPDMAQAGGSDPPDPARRWTCGGWVREGGWIDPTTKSNANTQRGRRKGELFMSPVRCVFVFLPLRSLRPRYLSSASSASKSIV
jgi:alanyl-tRNA synthetase